MLLNSNQFGEFLAIVSNPQYGHTDFHVTADTRGAVDHLRVDMVNCPAIVIEELVKAGFCLDFGNGSILVYKFD
jgi:hypothetical protein